MANRPRDLQLGSLDAELTASRVRFEPEEVAAWIAEGEGRRLEFKSGLPQPERVARTLVAFANTNGGILLVGVEDNGRVLGVPRPRQVVDRLRTIAAKQVQPELALELRAVPMEGGTVVCCSVPLSPDRPHAVAREDGTREICVRVGSSNRVADGATRRAVTDKPARGGLDVLERRIIAWVAGRARQGAMPNSDATVRAFARSNNVGLQRARRAFVKLEGAGRLVGHGPGAQRVYGLP